jgi:polysaccharide biosynthesis/export protein
MKPPLSRFPSLKSFPGLVASAMAMLLLPVHSLEIPSSLSKKLFGEGETKDMGGLNGGADMPDNSIDPNRYIVGGGDRFQVSIIGMPNQEFYPTINHDGNVFVGDFGFIKVGKVTLTEAIEIIRKHVQKSLRGRYEAYVTLVKVKRPIITVSGEVQSPGTFQLNGTMRLLDALKLANHGTLPNPEEFNFREIECRQGDSLRTYDLLRAMANGDISQNPYVYPGDNLMLRRVDQRVFVDGEINGQFLGRLPFKRGETLGELLGQLSFKASADSNYILVQQFDPGGKAVPMRKVSMAEAASLPLGDRDVITIGKKENYQQSGTAKVTGESVRPGTFPILENGTTAEDLLRLAGGARASGDLARAYVVKARIFPGSTDVDRSGEIKVLGENRLPNQKDAALAALRKIRPEDNTALSDLNTTGDGMIIDIRDKGSEIPLQDGDRIHIPKKAYYVYVSGAVRNPGPYLYKAGKAYSYYIGQAGGYTSKSDRKNEFVLTMYQDLAKIKDGSRVAEGDILVIPTRLEYKTFSTVWVPVMQIIPTILSLGLSVFILQNQLSKD